jgi:subtilisin
MTDLDGQPGGFQPPTGECSSFLNQEVGPVVDDKAAFFSNFATVPDGKVHTISAPGVCIGSTYPGDSYNVSSGISFATPLVSGVVALCICNRALRWTDTARDRCPSPTPPTTR